MGILVFLTLLIVQDLIALETRPLLETIFLGRCAQYQALSNGNRTIPLSKSLSCVKMWEMLSKVFKGKAMCNITEESYKDYFSNVKYRNTLVDKAMFWSGTKEIAHDLSYINHEYYTLEDTFAGYVVDALDWCGCRECTDGYLMKSCSLCSQSRAYWKKASRDFAELASGKAFVMLNSTPKKKETAFWSKSIFGEIELPTMGKKKHVKELMILLVASIGKKPTEHCNKGSVVDLKREAAKYNLTVKCEDNPSMVASLLCAKYPNAPQCNKTYRNHPSAQFAKNPETAAQIADLEEESRRWEKIGKSFIVVSAVAILLSVTVIFMARKSLCRKPSGACKPTRLSESM